MDFYTSKKSLLTRTLAMRAFLPFSFLLALLFMTGCVSEGTSAERPNANRDYIYLATTTSTYDSGLMDALLPEFTAKTGIEVRVMAQATGQAMELGKRGDVDAIFVHDRAAELELVKEGYFVERFDVMYNDFVLLGPPLDPAGIREMTDVKKAMEAVASGQFPFVSRGDDSGTHRREISLWEGTSYEPWEENWYYQVGQGMAGTLRVANEILCYILSDRGTYLSLKEILDLEIVLEGDSRLLNQYGVMAVNPERHSGVNYGGSMAFIEFLKSPEGQDLIAGFTVEGEQLFFPGQSEEEDKGVN